MATPPNDVPLPGSPPIGRADLFFDPRNNTRQSQIIEAMDLIRDLPIQSVKPVPQLVVCGAQSSGKSSVLGALAGIQFPSGDQMCTRYVTKVTLEYNLEASMQVAILPGKNRSRSEKKRLEQFQRNSNGDSQETLRTYMREAHEAIFHPAVAPTTGDGNQEIREDTLVVKISGPEKRALQLVDLPGLIMFHKDDRTIIDRIRQLVEEYIKMPQSTILAVVPANYDMANAEILTLCQNHDPNGERTLGIITKPDTLSDSGPETIVKIMEGRDSSFSNFEWHVVRNLDSDAVQAQASMTDRDLKEAATLDKPPWRRLPKAQRGIYELRSRLRQTYFEAVEKELPGFRDEVRLLLKNRMFDGLADELSDGALAEIFKKSIKRLRKVASEHSQGNYGESLSGLASNGPERLRARINDKDKLFKNRVHDHGHAWRSLAAMQPLKPKSALSNGRMPPTPPPNLSSHLSHEQYDNLEAEKTMVRDILKETSGVEPPGFYDPKRTINELFWKESVNWHAFAKEHVEEIFICCQNYFAEVTKMEFARTNRSIHLDQPPDGFENCDAVAARFLKNHILPELMKAKTKAHHELWRIEEDRTNFVKTRDNRFDEDQQDHRRRKRYGDTIGIIRHQHNNVEKQGPRFFDTGSIDEQSDDADHNADEYLNAMLSYYRIARDVFVANVITQVEERHFLREIEDLIPDDLDLGSIKEITREDSKSAKKKQERRELKRKLERTDVALGRCLT